MSAATKSRSVVRIEQYLLRSQLDHMHAYAPRIEMAIHNLMSALGNLPQRLSLDALYSYPVPMLSEDGSCSLIDELAPTPFDLSAMLGGRHEATSRKLMLLNQIVEHTTQLTGADWIGVYQARNHAPTNSQSNAAADRVLVKLAYRGRPSRAVFPLTREFAQGSTNSAVGLSGHAKVIDDVAAYTASGGGFYVCDDAVQSEACVPMFDEGGALVGIIDAEAAPQAFFNEDRLSTVIAAALVVPTLLP
jgi:L-methionine (R)-S-oxide reductase